MRPIRRTKMTTELMDAAWLYLEVYEVVYGHVIPSLKGLARIVGVAERTLYTWAKKDEDFAFFKDMLLAEQEVVLWNKGMRGEYNPGLVKLALGKHGYSDKQDNKVDGGFTVVIGDKDAATL